MLREFFITFYLFTCSILFKISKCFPLQKKVVFYISFVENNAYIYNQMRKKYPDIQCILLAHNQASYKHFSERIAANDRLLLFRTKKIFSFIQAIYHLATANVVVVDNYYGILAVTNFKPSVKRLQIWHANGAVKRFGRMDPSIQFRSKRANARFLKVYKQFEYILVGSKKMEDIFIQAFGASKEQMLHLGIPRTDLFFNQQKMEETIESLYLQYPILKRKKVILYAPTFRDGNTNDFSIPLDFALLKKKLADSYVFLIKLHPAITNSIQLKDDEDFIIDLSSYSKMNDLLFISDFLITDYSSIPFEYSFLNKPMIFFPYDLESYQSTRGFWVNYEELVPGPIVYTTEQLIAALSKTLIEDELLIKFHHDWNQYSTGHSSENVADQLATWVEKF